MTSINTNISAYYAQNNLRAAGSMAQSSIAKLSSGQRIIKASDDVAALSIGTILRTNVSTLKTALVNTNQGSTVLQVADGALARLGEILQRQKSLAVQANSGTLSNAERGYLQQEFKALTDEYDRIVNNTNFNNVKLLDGSLAGADAVDPETPVEEVPFATTNDMSGNTYMTAMGDFDDNDMDPPGFAGDWSSATVALNLLNAGNDETFEIVITIGTNTYTSAALDSAGTIADQNGIVFTGDDGSSFTMDFGDIFDGEAYDTAGSFGTLQADLEAEFQAIVMEGPGIEPPAEPVAYTITGDLSGGTYVLTNPVLDASGVADGETAGFIGSWADIQVTANLLNAGNDETFELVLTLNGVTYTSTALDSAATIADQNGVVFTGDDGSTITLDFADIFDGEAYDTAGSFGTLEADLAAELAQITVAEPEAPVEEEAAGPLSFQVGSLATDTISISIKSLKSTDVYKNEAGAAVTLNIGTAAGAVTASDVLDRAIKTLISTRADVGALQSRFGYAASALEVSIQNIDAARSQFLDADISEESTNFAKAQVLQQAAISVLAQANQIPQNLLKLIG